MFSSKSIVKCREKSCLYLFYVQPGISMISLFSALTAFYSDLAAAYFQYLSTNDDDEAMYLFSILQIMKRVIDDES